ncbi:MAG TPA: glycosyltransferase family 39 protein [Allosphingosinicella sp.]|jgi:hypothetical protein|uniref:ArnT family glycosyltransferase n=1 Tax=Allosphingosinicella sp. TaxID=2823234 RepID=UPI002F270CF9
MTFSALPTSRLSLLRSRWVGAIPAAHPVALSCLAFLFVISPALFKHPAETGDPVEYLHAARCVAERWFCAPHDHWSARWPIFAPTGLLLRLWGESRVTIGMLPLLHGFAAVGLFTAILSRAFGKPAALIGGLLFAATPLISELAMQLNADIVELSFLLAGVFAVACSDRGRRAGTLVLAGALFALAVETRLTAAVAGLLIACGLLAWRWPVRAFLLIGAGGLLVLGASMAAHWIGTGDPLTLYRLSLAHTKVPTTELPDWVDTSGSPFFNLDLIRNWSRAVSVHWTVDPAINLLASPKVGLSLGAALLALLLGRGALSNGSAEMRAVGTLIVGSLAFLIIAAFALSIHPTPRMFLPLLAAAVAMTAILVSTARADLRPLILFGLVPLLLAQSFVLRSLTYDPIDVERMAQSWVVAEREPVATDWLTRRHLGLAPAVRALPEDVAAAPLQLLLAPGACEVSPKRRPGWTVRRAALLRRSHSGIGRMLQRAGIGAQREQWSLCLYRNALAQT